MFSDCVLFFVSKCLVQFYHPSFNAWLDFSFYMIKDCVAEHRTAEHSMACLEHVCLGHVQAHVCGIIWGISGACLGHHLSGSSSVCSSLLKVSAVLHASLMPFLSDPGIPGVRSMGPSLSH